MEQEVLMFIYEHQISVAWVTENNQIIKVPAIEEIPND
jgi:hypothetical protein